MIIAWPARSSPTVIRAGRRHRVGVCRRLVRRPRPRVVDGINAMPHLVIGVVIAALWRGEPVAIIASIALTTGRP